MKKIFWLLAFILCLSIVSCNSIKYDKPQPVSALSSIDIPKHLVGKYQKDEANKIFIYEDGIVVDFERSSLYKTKYKIDSSLVLFNSMHGIFANLMDSAGLWDCFLINYNDTSLTIFNSDIDKVFSDSTQWIDNKNTSKGIDFEFSLDSSYVIINNIDYLNLYRSFNNSSYELLNRK
tara:strand:- start:1366 stop:1896 length:531 start_codon:yes stop_codon:yes gene_type:complete